MASLSTTGGNDVVDTPDGLALAIVRTPPRNMSKEPAPPWTMKQNPKAGKCPVRGCRNCSRPMPGNRGKSWRSGLCNKHSMHLWRLENKPRAYFSQIRDRARRKDIVFTITFQDFLDAVNATGYLEKRGRQSFNLHLDRRDALKGYERGNLRVITAGENCSKGATEDKKRRAAFIAARLGYDPRKKPEPPEPYDYEPTDNCPFESIHAAK